MCLRGLLESAAGPLHPLASFTQLRTDGKDAIDEITFALPTLLQVGPPEFGG